MEEGEEEGEERDGDGNRVGRVGHGARGERRRGEMAR